MLRLDLFLQLQKFVSENFVFFKKKRKTIFAKKDQAQKIVESQVAVKISWWKWRNVDTVRFRISIARILIKMKISSYKLENFNQDKNLELLTQEF